MKQVASILITGAAEVLTMVPQAGRRKGLDLDEAELGIIKNGAVAIGGDRIIDVGTTDRISDMYDGETVIDATGKVVAPGLIDAHTHSIFAGSREKEFARRMRGAGYLEISKSGGGIHSTVRATRDASLDELVTLSLPRLDALLDYGVTTVEVKSGYGLDFNNEIKMLEAAKRLNESHPTRIVPTYLGAHAVPQEQSVSREAYVDLMTTKVIPEVARRSLATACDVYLESGAFSREEAEAVLSAAAQHGLRPKIHAGQFSDLGGPELVAGLKGLSADHLEWISEDGLAAMAEKGVVAVLLPGAALTLGDALPDARRFRKRGIDVAVATDNNPGTSRTENLPLMAALAVMRMGLSIADGWKAITVNAARALGLENELGVLLPERFADIVIFSIPEFRSLFYHFGVNHSKVVIANGRVVKEVNGS